LVLKILFYLLQEDAFGSSSKYFLTTLPVRTQGHHHSRYCKEVRSQVVVGHRFLHMFFHQLGKEHRIAFCLLRRVGLKTLMRFCLPLLGQSGVDCHQYLKVERMIFVILHAEDSEGVSPMFSPLRWSFVLTCPRELFFVGSLSFRLSAQCNCAAFLPNYLAKDFIPFVTVSLWPVCKIILLVFDFKSANCPSNSSTASPYPVGPGAGPGLGTAQVIDARVVKCIFYIPSFSTFSDRVIIPGQVSGWPMARGAE
jgi:hypothetical protein